VAAWVAAWGLLQYLAIAAFATDASFGDGRIQGDLVSGIKSNCFNILASTLGDTGFFRLQGIVKATNSGVFEDLKFKISECSDQN
jgi:hypothetical protein